MKRFLCIFLLFVLFSCVHKESNALQNGIYRGVLHIQDQKELPFIFEVTSKNTLTIFNADEKIFVDEITYKNDSIYIQTPVFEGYISAKIMNNGNLIGQFVKPSLNRIVPFSTSKSSERFVTNLKASTTITGNWETVFSKDSPKEKYIAKGIFHQQGNHVTGTFRTTTGDYRYLEGVVHGDSLKLSTFDGAHAFLFTAKVTDSTMNGFFYSGNHWKEPFTAKLNNNYELPSAEKLTFLKEGFDQFNFSFPDATGKMISLQDKRFKNKVVLVQIMGTWCPNCLDESKYYVNFIKENPNKDVQFIALAFEYAKTKENAFKSIKRLKDEIGIPYPILLAQFGSESKKLAHEKLPMLNHVLSYPTTIYIDKKGKVRKIHTGFNGPATGKKHEEFKQEFDFFINQLLIEK